MDICPDHPNHPRQNYHHDHKHHRLDHHWIYLVDLGTLGVQNMLGAVLKMHSNHASSSSKIQGIQEKDNKTIFGADMHGQLFFLSHLFLQPSKQSALSWKNPLLLKCSAAFFGVSTLKFNLLD